MKLNKLSVRDIMTPRPVIFSADKKMSIQDYFVNHAEKPFSRIPIYDQNTDNIKGYVLKDDLLTAQAKDEFTRTLEEFSIEFPVLTDKISAAQAFDRLMHDKSHISLIVDEYGTIQGLVTLEDVLETLIGFEIVDEKDTVEDMQAYANQQWHKRMQKIGISPDDLLNDEKDSEVKE